MQDKRIMHFVEPLKRICPSSKGYTQVLSDRWWSGGFTGRRSAVRNWNSPTWCKKIHYHPEPSHRSLTHLICHWSTCLSAAITTPKVSHVIFSNIHIVRFDVLMAVTMKIATFWNVMVCSVIEVYQCFGGTNCLHLLDFWRIRQERKHYCLLAVLVWS